LIAGRRKSRGGRRPPTTGAAAVHGAWLAEAGYRADRAAAPR
jgi:hypothetical protein